MKTEHMALFINESLQFLKKVKVDLMVNCFYYTTSYICLQNKFCNFYIKDYDEVQDLYFSYINL